MIIRTQRDWRDDAGQNKTTWRFAYPADSPARSLSDSVTEPYATDFREASAIVNLSPQGSAALSRRIVQMLLRERGAYGHNNLVDQIEAFVNGQQNPAALKENLHYLREIGNFAAHPMKSTNSGEVMPVQPGEAEWALDVVEGLFDFYFVGPARDAARRQAFDDRIREAGRQPL